MTTGDSYHHHRAQAELRMAERATDAAVAKVHLDLANHHLERFYHPNAPWPPLPRDG